jgi:hypothetical protein
MAIRIDGQLGDSRGAHITQHRLPGPRPTWLAVYRTEFNGMTFPAGFGESAEEATNDLWSKLHGH